jgi:hypothetical protein
VFLTPWQTSVLGADQPLYAFFKQIQWQYVEELGENKLVIMMGALHIEDKIYGVIDKLLRDSGWSSPFSSSGFNIRPCTVDAE